MSAYIFVDGSKKPHMDAEAFAILVVFEKDQFKVYKDHKIIPKGTNNIAEWNAVILGIQLGLDHIDELTERVFIFADSSLTVNHINGIFHRTANHLKPLKQQAQQLLSKLRKDKRVIISWIPREFNIADPHHFDKNISQKEFKKLLEDLLETIASS